MSLFGTGRREGILAVLVLLLFSAVLHAPALLAGRQRATVADSDQQFEATTNRTLLVPAMRAAAEAVQQGELPLWNTDARFGEPFRLTGAVPLYAPFWLLTLAPLPFWLAVVMALHTFFACMFLYRFLRALPLSRYVAFVCGGLYGLGWFLTANLDRLPEAAAAALLPLALEIAWRVVINRGRAILLPLCGLSIALLFWTGSQSTAVLGTLLCVAVVVAELPVLDDKDRAAVLKTLAGAAVIAALATAPLWLALLQDAPAIAANAGVRPAGLQAAGLWSTLAPSLFSDLAGNSCEVLQAVNPGADPLELALYPGALVLFLLLLGLLRPKHTYLGVFWLLVIGTGLLLTIDGPVTDVVGRWLPARFAKPGAALVLFHLGIVVWAGLALENFFDAPMRRGFATPLTAAVGLLSMAALVAALLSGQVVTLLQSSTGIGFAPDLELGRASLLRALLPTVVALTAVCVLFLVWRRLGVLRFKPLLAAVVFAELLFHGLAGVTYDTPAAAPQSASIVPDGDDRVAIVSKVVAPAVADLMADGRAILTTNGDAILHRTASYLRLIDPGAVRVGARTSIGTFTRERSLAHPLLANARVGTLVGGQPVRIAGFTPLGATPAGETAPPRAHVARRNVPAALRLLFVACNTDSATTAAGVLRNPLFDPYAAIVIEGGDPDFRPHQPAGAPGLQVVASTRNRLAVRIDMHEGRGYLLSDQAWAPGWTATVDGTTVPLLPANLAFRALAVPEGTHEIVFRYAPWAATLGLPALGLGLLLALTLGLLGTVRRRT